MIKIGFVILTWNSEKYIKKCLKSILSLDGYYKYIVVIDNGSTDDTLQTISEVEVTKDSSLKLIKNKKNEGTTKPRNEGIKYLRQFPIDYYCVLDSDTIVNKKAIDSLIKTLESDASYGIVGPKMITGKGNEILSARRFPTLQEKLCKIIPLKVFQKIGEEKEKLIPIYDALGAYPADYLMSACWFVKPGVFDLVGLFDEKIFYAPEDVEFCIRVWKQGYKVVFQPNASIVHYWMRLSKKRFISRHNLAHVLGIFYIYVKHWDLYKKKIFSVYDRKR